MSIPNIPFNRALKVKSLAELKAMGITDGALLISDGYYSKSLFFTQVEFDERTAINGKTGFHFRETDKGLRIRVPIECVEFDFDTFIDENPEFFI